MRILVASYMCELLNHGDTAMLQTAVKRFKAQWPDARVDVLVRTAERLALCCPGATPLLDEGRREWFRTRILPSRVYNMLPARIAQGIRAVDDSFRLAWPKSGRRLVSLKRRFHPWSATPVEQFWEALRHADLICAAGGGHITDAFQTNAELLLKTLHVGTRMRTPVVMLGQGFGPVAAPRLRTLCRNVLPRVGFISLREDIASGPFLRQMGVSSERVVTTGDDAIEMAFDRRREQLGTAIGVNLRLAKYSSVPSECVQIVGGVLGAARQCVDSGRPVPLAPLPISLNPEDSDIETIRQILAAADVDGDGGETLDMPERVIDQAGQCRIVVTGSYHAAVFALAQGIPVVGLAKSQYYIDKFEGLSRQFPGGCHVVLLDGAAPAEALHQAIDVAWRLADTLRPRLLQAAEHQIGLGKAAYARVFDLVSAAQSP